jgi:hypothetical protein
MHTACDECRSVLQLRESDALLSLSEFVCKRVMMSAKVRAH